MRKKIMETTPFTMATKIYICINLIKHVKGLYDNSLKKKIEDFRRWKNPPFSWISKINIVKIDILTKAIYRLIATKFFTELKEQFPTSY